MDISRQFINNPVRVWLTILLLGIGGILPCSISAVWKIRPLPLKRRWSLPTITAHRRNRSKKRSPFRWKMPCNKLPYLDNVRLYFVNGLSQITVNIASNYHSNELPANLG